MIIPLLLLALALVSAFLYFRGKFNENYWKKRGVIFHGENKVFGPFWDFVVQKRPLFKIFNDIYVQYPHEPAVGVGSLFTPSLYVKDKTNVQFVMQSPEFTDRGFDYNKEDLLADNILFMSGIRWKLMRQKMTPLFTVSKLKNQFHVINKCAEDFVVYLRNNPDKRRTKTFDTMTTFSCAALSAAVFGVNVNETDFRTPFLEAARQAFHPTFWRNIRFSIAHISPFLFKFFNLKFFNQYEDFFFNAMKQVFKLRDQESIKKHDFADVCLGIQKQGTIKHEKTGYEMEPTDELLSAQAFFFFGAGAEPTAGGIFAALMGLGEHLDDQEKLQKEIDNTFTKYDGKLNLEAVMEMEYLEKVICEAMRLYPPIAYVTRRCIEDTVLPVGNIRIEKGTKIYTPIYEYHRDPNFFNDPEKFDPERFSDDAKKAMGITYMPFGYGQRMCIGFRYARLQVKCALVHILRNFNLRTRVHGDVKYGADQVQLRMLNVDVEINPRNNYK